MPECTWCGDKKVDYLINVWVLSNVRSSNRGTLVDVGEESVCSKCCATNPSMFMRATNPNWENLNAMPLINRTRRIQNLSTFEWADYKLVKKGE
jgi:hypothetical protein